MRKKVIAGNWKMNNDLKETQNLLSKLTSGISMDNLNCDVIVCPAFTSLSEAYTLLKDTKIKLGAQNMYFETSGAFTGEISASMLKSVGCEYVILGHSERRTIFGETDELINNKIKKANASGLKPIFCVGELLEEREAGITEKVIEKQIRSGLKDISSEEMGNVIIAYEPVWAIGTGKTASPQQAEEVHKFIRSLINDKYGASVSENIIIQYGGSVNNKNARELLSQKDIDGALVGGASLKADSFIEIIQAT
jgi:triosephosphate isomerase (TIM)